MSEIRRIRKTGITDDIRKKYPVFANRVLESNVKGGVELLKGIMPVRTGHMRDSTEAVPSGNGWAIKIGVDYWRFVNDGTIYIEGQHFVEKAVESIKRGISEDLRRFASFLK